MEFWGEKSCLLVPLVFKDEVIGCLELVEKRAVRRFSAEERELAGTLAALAAVAIQNARLYGDVEHLAITDGLTGLYNHRYFYDRLAQEVARAQRYELPLSLLMIDIDDFKSLQRRATATAPATRLLRELGGVLRAADAPADRPGRALRRRGVRHHPAEHRRGRRHARRRAPARRRGRRRPRRHSRVLVGRRRRPRRRRAAATQADEADGHDGGSGAAHVVGERIRSSIEGETFGTGERPPVITVSVGVASLPEHATTADGLVDEADGALYRAKRLGKNRVEVDDKD